MDFSFHSIQRYLQPDFNLQSRIHPLRAYISPPEGSSIWVKREDELSSGISGSKYRKLASLLQFWQQHGVETVIAIGGEQSNNILSVRQILIENGIKGHYLLLEGHIREATGNALFFRMMNNAEDIIEYISREDWPEINNLAKQLAALYATEEVTAFVLPEGSQCREALPGILSMAADILRNEAEKDIFFDHIFTDSGTGHTAIGLILGLAMAGSIRREIHITLIAGSQEDFLQNLDDYTQVLHNWFGLPKPKSLPRLHFHRPPSGLAFGSINTGILKETIHIASDTGILMEPVYSVKHLMSAKKVIEKGVAAGNSLFIYNGGSLGLSGFQERLAGVL